MSAQISCAEMLLAVEKQALFPLSAAATSTTVQFFSAARVRIILFNLTIYGSSNVPALYLSITVRSP